MSLKEKRELVIVGLPYIIRYQVRTTISKFEDFKMQDIADVLKPYEVVLKPDGHAYTFCFAPQFLKWAHALK